MLHEILLALSGHPSSLFPPDSGEIVDDGRKSLSKDSTLLSPSERSLLETVSSLAKLHCQIRENAETIVSEHPSNICRAVAASLLHTHLARFTKKVIDVENQILTKNATLVGAYNIVPLSAVVGEFDEWTRRMRWYRKIATYIQDPNQSRGARTTGASLIDHLRRESQTGYPDVEHAAVELSQVAEKAWIKQLSVWLLYGNLPTHGPGDFFVSGRSPADPGGAQFYVANTALLPELVSRQTAASLLFVGKSLHQVKQHRQSLASHSSIDEDADDRALLFLHAQALSSLTLPLTPSMFSNVISGIRSSLSQKVLQRILPPGDILLVLTTINQFFLLKRTDFATALINEAHKTLDTRQGDLGRFLQNDGVQSTRDFLVKEGEVADTLNRVWKTLTAIQTDDLEDEVLDFAREHIRLIINSNSASRPSTADESLHDIAPLSDVEFEIASKPPERSTGNESVAKTPPSQKSLDPAERLPDAMQQGSPKPHIPHDPETLSTGHKLFLSSLTHSLLLTDLSYTRSLRTLLGNIEQLVAYFTRLQQVQKNFDLDVASGIASGYAEDESDIQLQLDRARKRVDSGMKDLVGRLREIDHERYGSGGLARLNLGPAEGNFEPWQGGGVDRLLMKLDFGRVTEDELMSA
ncbi:hypothetical protein MBLNU459_g1302t2 [Dothideomycetes sp. NU459]